MKKTILVCTAAAALAVSVAASLPSRSSARTDGIACAPTDVFTNADTGVVGVNCAVAQNGVTFIMMTGDNASRADQFIEMATSAMLSGMNFFVWTDDDPSQKPDGCDAGCTRATQFGLSKP